MKAHVPYYEMRLFITGATPNSVKAVANMKKICETYFQGNYKLEIIDLYQQPFLAKDEQLIALPMLIKSSPSPIKRLIGDMSDANKVLKSLDYSL